jgi:hypothetical protein
MQRAVSQVDALEAAIHHCLDHVHDMAGWLPTSRPGSTRLRAVDLPPPRTFEVILQNRGHRPAHCRPDSADRKIAHLRSADGFIGIPAELAGSPVITDISHSQFTIPPFHRNASTNSRAAS